MVNEIIIAGIICLLTTTIGVYIALKIQARSLHKMGLEHEAWQNAQEAHQNIWDEKQKKQVLELERLISKEMHEIREEWQRWEYNAAQHYAKVTLEQKLATLPYIEDIPVPSHEYPKYDQIATSGQLSHPISFFRTDLRGQDLSRRFLQYADFRESQLENANFYMTDLAGASFKGANLAGANLSGANLAGADLREAILTDTNLLVTDLNGAILNGAKLFGARNLTKEQFNSALFNHETQIDLEQNITHPRIARMHIDAGEAMRTEFESPVQGIQYDGKSRINSN